MLGLTVWALTPVVAPWVVATQARVSDALRFQLPLPPPRRWHDRTPTDGGWDDGAFLFRVLKLESSGSLFRIRVQTRLRGFYGADCTLAALEVATAEGRPLARWKVGRPISGAGGWTSALLTFHAPRGIHELRITLQTDPAGLCRDQELPVVVR